MPSATELLRLVLDPERLAILGKAALGPVDPDELGGSLGAPGRRVRAHIAKLRTAGLLTEELRLDVETLRGVAIALSEPDSSGPVADGPWSGEERELIGRFLQGGRLIQMPAARGKRRLVLEWIAQEFEPGIRYSERTVDHKLREIFADHATLRRYLVDEGFLTRADGVYWRTGGRYDPPESTARGAR